MKDMPAKVAVWLVLAEINSLVGTDEDCAECHHCPICCGACYAILWSRDNWPELGAWVAKHCGTSWTWLDGDAINWPRIIQAWETPCPER